MADLPGCTRGLLVLGYKGKEADRLVTRNRSRREVDGGDGAKLADPAVSGFQQYLPDGRPWRPPEGEFTV
jgi:hypothetical protein